MSEGTWVGLDVHARKVVAGVLDAASCAACGRRRCRRRRWSGCGGLRGRCGSPLRRARRGMGLRARRPKRPPPPPTLADARAARQTTHDRRGRGRGGARRTLLGTGNDVAAPEHNGPARRAHRRTAREATRGTATSRPPWRRSTLESGTASHIAHPVLRSRPAHISRDTTRRQRPVRSPRRKTKARTRGPPSHAHLMS
jgi:hypothetical protein